MDEEKIFYNAVAIAVGGDPHRVRKLKKRYWSSQEGWRYVYANLKNNGGMLSLFEEAAPEEISINPETGWKRLDELGIRLILFEDDDYPTLLREIHDPPLGIYILGKLPPGDRFAIVGTRRATPDGKSNTKKFARELAGAGFTIVSGLALGIDAAAHEGCLDGSGKAIAVLAGGLDDVYPSTNEWLAKKIIKTGGAIISEYPLGSPPYPSRFLERNRIVSGLSKGALIVECPKNSGSLATARFALEQNRDVFVVPGSISHPNFFGSHSLIRQGATLVTKPEDILEAYDMLDAKKLQREDLSASDEEKQVLLALHDAARPLDVDKIIEATKLEPRIANQTLSFLLLKRLITETEVGYIIE